MRVDPGAGSLPRGAAGGEFSAGDGNGGAEGDAGQCPQRDLSQLCPAVPSAPATSQLPTSTGSRATHHRNVSVVFSGPDLRAKSEKDAKLHHFHVQK